MKTLKLGMFPISVGVITNRKQFERERKRYGLPADMFPEQDKDGTLGMCVGLRGYSGGEFVIVIFDSEVLANYPIHNVVGFAVHESVHAYDLAMEYVGEENAGFEGRAYSVQMISEFVVEHVLGDIEKLRVENK